MNEKSVDGSESCSLYQSRGEPDGQHNAHKSASLGSSRSNSSTSSISGVPCSRGGIGRSLLDSEMIEEKLKQMSIQPLEEDMALNEVDDFRINSISQFTENVFHLSEDGPIPAPRCKLPYN